MKQAAVFLLLLLILSCRKDHGGAAPYSPPPVGSAPAVSQDPSWIKVDINQIPMVVDSIYFQRGTSTVHFMAANRLQRVDVYTFNLFGSSGLNYQYQDSLTYTTRKDTASQWQVVRAPYATSRVTYTCCGLATKDSPVKGTFIEDFGVESNLYIQGSFYLRF